MHNLLLLLQGYLLLTVGINGLGLCLEELSVGLGLEILVLFTKLPYLIKIYQNAPLSIRIVHMKIKKNHTNNVSSVVLL